MALWVCEGCSCCYSVGAPACPHCGSVQHHEEGSSVMPKITVHGGPSIAGASVVGAAWSDTSEPDEWPTTVGDADTSDPVSSPEDEPVVSVSVDGVDQGPGEVDETLGEEFKPLADAAEGEASEQASDPNYKAWTVKQLRDELGKRELPTSGKHAELVTRLRTHDEP